MDHDSSWPTLYSLKTFLGRFCVADCLDNGNAMPGGGWQLGIDDIGNVLCVLFLSLILHITLAPPCSPLPRTHSSITQFEEWHLSTESSAYISLFFVDVSKYFCDFVSKSNTDTQQNGNEAASTIWRRESCEVGRHTEEMVATFMAPDFYNIHNKMWNILLSLSLSYHNLHPIKICATSCLVFPLETYI